MLDEGFPGADSPVDLEGASVGRARFEFPASRSGRRRARGLVQDAIGPLGDGQIVYVLGETETVVRRALDGLVADQTMVRPSTRRVWSLDDPAEDSFREMYRLPCFEGVARPPTGRARLLRLVGATGVDVAFVRREPPLVVESYRSRAVRPGRQGRRRWVSTLAIVASAGPGEELERICGLGTDHLEQRWTIGTVS